MSYSIVHVTVSGLVCRCTIMIAQESAFLVCSVIILTAGMIFTSKGFGPGSTGYNLSVAVTASAIIVSTSVFLALLVFEVYRSVKYAAIHDVARQVRGAGSTGSTSANA